MYHSISNLLKFRKKVKTYAINNGCDKVQTNSDSNEVALQYVAQYVQFVCEFMLRLSRVETTPISHFLMATEIHSVRGVSSRWLEDRKSTAVVGSA